MKFAVPWAYRLLVLGLCIAPLQALAQTDWNAVKLRGQKLHDNLAMITGKGGNMALLWGSDAVLLVDDQFAPLADKLVTEVMSLSGGKIDYIVNTHWHGDHTGGNAGLATAGAIIYAHENVRRELVKRHFEEAFVKGSAVQDPRLPVITFTDGITFHINGETVEVQKVPAAHTDGDSIVYFHNADVLHMGDTFFNGLYSFFDRSSGGTFDGLIEALEMGLALAGPETQIIPGHGKLATRSELESHLERLRIIGERVGGAIEAGQKWQSFIAGNPTADLEAAYEGSFKVMAANKFLALVWRDLKNKKR